MSLLAERIAKLERIDAAEIGCRAGELLTILRELHAQREIIRCARELYTMHEILMGGDPSEDDHYAATRAARALHTALQQYDATTPGSLAQPVDLQIAPSDCPIVRLSDCLPPPP